jgi:PAS domain S-box-containing protein
MKILFLILLIILNFIPNSLNAEEWGRVKDKGKGKITVFYYNSDNFISDVDGKLKGIEYDIFIMFKTFLKNQYQVELEIEFKKSTSFSGLYEEIKFGGNGEFGACSFSITEKRLNEVGFSPKYMPDVEVLINSNNIPIANNKEEFKKIFNSLTALNVPNTTFEEDLKWLKTDVQNFKIENVELASMIRDRILKENNLFGYIELPNYLKLYKEGTRFKRQNLYKVERMGYGVIFPKNSNWSEPINEFFNSEGFKLEMNRIIKEVFGEGVEDLLWKIKGDVNESESEEISLLTMEREVQALDIERKALLLEKENTKTELLIGAIVLILLILFLLFYGYRMKKSVNESLVFQNKMIAEQKDELEKLSLVASKTSNGVIILNKNNQIEWHNESYKRITGYDKESFGDKSPGDVLVSEDNDKEVLKTIRKKIEDKLPWKERIQINSRKGDKLWLEINNTPVFDEDGNVSRYIEIIDDVTDKVENEIELKRLSIIAEKMNEAVLITDTEGKIEYYNYGLVRNSGYTEEEFKEIFKEMMYLQKITARSDIQEIMERFKTNPEPFFYDSKHTKKDGSTMWTTASLSPVYDAKNELSKIIVVYTDIDERKEFVNELSEKNKEILDSINYALRIQNAMLPSNSNLNKIFDDLFVLFKPKDIVSGDFYWFEQVGDYSIVVLADCTGHGVPGAFMSMMGANFLSNIVSDNQITSTGDALLILNDKVKNALKTEGSTARDGMDIVMMAYNKKLNILDFSGGNNSIFIYRDGEMLKYKGERFSIGADGIEDKNFIEQNIVLQKGDAIYTFTDGYKDQFGGPKGKKFMQKKLLEIIQENAMEPMKKQQEILENELSDWMKGYDQVDDISVLGFRV